MNLRGTSNLASKDAWASTTRDSKNASRLESEILRALA